MKKISLKRVLAFTSIAIVLLISILSQIGFESISITTVIDKLIDTIFDGSVVFIYAYIVLGVYDLFKDSKRSGIIDLLCAGTFALLRMILSDYFCFYYYYFLWSEVSFIVLFIIFAIFTILNVFYETKKYNEKNIVVDIIVSIVLFAICLGIIFIPVVQVKRVNNENIKALIENKDAIWKGKNTPFYLITIENEKYDVLNEKLEKVNTIDANIRIYNFAHIYSGGNSSTIGILYDNKDDNLYVYNNCFDKVCQIKKFKYIGLVDRESYLEELLTQAKRNRMIDYDELKKADSFIGEYTYNDFLSDGSKIIYEDDKYLGYIDTDGHRYVNEEDEYAVNIYDNYVVKYSPVKDQFEITSKEDSEDRREYDFVMPYDNFMVCCKEDRYEILNIDDLKVLFEMNINYGEDYDYLTAEDFLDLDAIRVFGNESTIVLSNYSEDDDYSESLIRFNKEEKRAELVADKIERIESLNSPKEYPNSLYMYTHMGIFESNDRKCEF